MGTWTLGFSIQLGSVFTLVFKTQVGVEKEAFLQLLGNPELAASTMPPSWYPCDGKGSRP